MVATVVVEAMYGDSGKGKLGAYLAVTGDFDYVVDGGGGPSAAHTMRLDDGRCFTTRQVPSGWPATGVQLRLGPGTVVSESVLREEVGLLAEWQVADRLAVDVRCGLLADRHVEAERSHPLLSDEISFEAGSTAARSDYLWRRAERAGGREEFAVARADVVHELNIAASRGATILVLGSHGFQHSLTLGDHYPITVSTDCSVGATAVAAGIAWSHVSRAVMVVNLAPTTTTNLPLADELDSDEVARRGLVAYGSVSGRRRRYAGRLDLGLLDRAFAANRPTELALGCADVFDPGVAGVRAAGGLSDRVRAMAEELERRYAVPVRYVSTGPGVFDVVERTGR